MVCGNDRAEYGRMKEGISGQKYHTVHLKCTDNVTHLGTNLVSTLAGLKMYDFPHFDVLKHNKLFDYAESTAAARTMARATAA